MRLIRHLKIICILIILISESVYALSFNEPIKIVSYNILSPLYLKYGNYDQLPEEIIGWDNRKLRILDILNNSAADVICLQEIDEEGFKYFQRQLSTYGYNGVYAGRVIANKDSVAIFYKHNVFKLQMENTHTFKGYDKVFQEAVLVSKDGNMLTVINTKIQWDNEDKPQDKHKGYKQLASMSEVLNINDSVSNTVICGDFNFEPKQLIGFLVAFNDVHKSQDFYTIRIDGKPKRVDYIFASKNLHIINGGTLINKDYVLDSPSIISPSDHLPIVVELQ